MASSWLVDYVDNCSSPDASPPPPTSPLPANSTDDPNLDWIWVDRIDAFVYGIAMPVVAVVGIIGNLINLCVLTRPNLMRIATYTYFRAIAVADLCSMLAVLPFIAQFLDHSDPTMDPPSYYWIFYRAHLSLPLLNALSGSSVLVIVAVTVDRFLSVCYPLHAKAYQTRMRPLAVIVCAWMMSFLLYLPSCFHKGVAEESECERYARVSAIRRFTLPPATVYTVHTADKWAHAFRLW